MGRYTTSTRKYKNTFDSSQTIKSVMGKCHGKKKTGDTCGRAVKIGYYCWQHKSQDPRLTSHSPPSHSSEKAVKVVASSSKPSPPSRSSEAEVVTCDICFEDDVPVEIMIICPRCNGSVCRKCVVASKSKLCPYCRYKKFFSKRFLTAKEKKEWKKKFKKTKAEREFEREHNTELSNEGGMFDILQEMNRHTSGDISDIMLESCTSLLESQRIPASEIARYIHMISHASDTAERIEILLTFGTTLIAVNRE